MNGEDKIQVFENELALIKDDKVKQVVEQIVQELPEYFFRVAASSTGKYHPPMSLGEGGLVRHTKGAVAVAKDLMSLEMFQPLKEHFDIIIGALILHDGLKHGEVESQYTKAEHPKLMHDFITSFTVDEDSKKDSILNRLALGVLTHMGQWNTDYRTRKELMPKPSTKVQNFIHLCDYLASRKYISMEF